MRGDRRIFALGLLLSAAAHAALFGAFRTFPVAADGTVPKAAPLALIAVPSPAAAPPIEGFLPVPAVPRVPTPEVAAEPILASAPAAVPEVVPPAAAPAVATPATEVAPATVPPSAQSEPAARRLAHGRYEQAVTQWVERQRAYPLAARRRGWEGTAIVRLRLAADGSLLTAQLVRDTGFALLDEAALGMVRRAAPFPRLPAEIGESHLEVLVPIHFSLGSSN